MPKNKKNGKHIQKERTAACLFRQAVQCVENYFGTVARDAGKLLRLPEEYHRLPDEKHLDVLDGLRVIFILIVGWYHIWQQSWLTPRPFEVSLDFLVRSGYEWVDAMLLLSGFLLYLPYVGEKKMNAAAFFKRRFARIVPTYYLCVLILLVFVVFPKGAYASFGDGLKDILAHLTFTHSLFPFSYTGSPINGVLWTLSVEAQFYLLFPLLCVCFKKKPCLTWVGMSAVAFGYRYFVGKLPDTALYINQLPAFLDVYANGFMAAVIYTSLRKRLQEENTAEKVFFTIVFCVCVWGIIDLLKAQAAENGLDLLRLGQMNRRFNLSVLLCGCIISSCFSVPLLRFLLGNRLMRFLSLVTFQFYMYHQAVAVQLKEWHIPFSYSDMPNFYSEQPWQTRYTLLCFGISLVLAIFITFLIERPVARWILREKQTEINGEKEKLSPV